MQRADRGNGKVGYAGWTIRGVLTVVSRVFVYAVDRGLIATSPMSAFRERERERRGGKKLPRVGKRQRILSDTELVALLDKAGEDYRPYRPLLATAAMGGLRLGELIGLTWANVDFEAEAIHVAMQLGRDGKRYPLKTETGVRDVDLDRCWRASCASTGWPRLTRRRGTSSSPPRRVGRSDIATSSAGAWSGRRTRRA